MNIPGLRDNVFQVMMSGGQLGWLVVLVAFMLVGRVAEKWAQSDTSRGMQYMGLGLYVVAQAIIFLPLLVIAEIVADDPNLIPAAGLLTLAIFGGLTLAVFVTGRDFSFMRTALSVMSWVALGIIVVSCIFPITLGSIFCYAMVALASGYILYHTSNVLYNYRTDQHVAASLALFASVALMFWYIVQIFMLRRD
jgi:FtsH-binding integral membrane protein